MQAIYDIAQLCFLKGIQHAVLSPGSRCAPITVSFARQEGIQKFIIPDERSAAFIGLGLSRTTQKATVLVCTSGSAAYNYAPGIAEAFFQHIPLLILTADRPPEWIDQLDGQTIRQEQIYGNHVKGSYTLPVDTTHPDAQWHVNRIINEAINQAQSFPMGPVHVNIPLREPFYPKESFGYSSTLKVIEPIHISSSFSVEHVESLFHNISSDKKILILAGQSISNGNCTKELEKLEIPVLTDCISNHTYKGAITRHDLILSELGTEKINSLQPDLLISFGNSIISKNTKIFLRKHKPVEHWHIQENGYVADTFQSLTKTWACKPEAFFSLCASIGLKSKNYLTSWQTEQNKVEQKANLFFEKENTFSELEAIQQTLQHLPSNCYLHLANSMPVRYVNYLGVKSGIEIIANRGTSGIDGIISTAVGNALATDKPVFVITGDMSFLYDRNAFWHNHLPKNLHILILNNHGGGIFRMIQGPSSLPEGEAYFVTDQKLTAENTLRDFNLTYYQATDRKSFQTHLHAFIALGEKSKVLEVITDGNMNTEVWNDFKKFSTK